VQGVSIHYVSGSPNPPTTEQSHFFMPLNPTMCKGSFNPTSKKQSHLFIPCNPTMFKGVSIQPVKNSHTFLCHAILLCLRKP
jgi:hypothetical protein